MVSRGCHLVPSRSRQVVGSVASGTAVSLWGDAWVVRPASGRTRSSNMPPPCEALRLQRPRDPGLTAAWAPNGITRMKGPASPSRMHHLLVFLLVFLVALWILVQTNPS